MIRHNVHSVDYFDNYLFFHDTCRVWVLLTCLSVLWSLKQPGPVETERTGGNNMKRRAINIIALNLGIVLVTYLPTLVIVSLNNILSPEIFNYLYYPAMYLTVFGGIVQPLKCI